MGASQSAQNNSEHVPLSRRGSKTFGGRKKAVTSPESVHSVMSTDEHKPCAMGTDPIERARKRARKDSESIDLNNGHNKNIAMQSNGEVPLPPPLPSEVFVSGASCRLPESDNLEEFWENLISGKDMVTEDERRWPPGLYNLPKRNGKLKDLSHFDAEFFRINPAQAHAMDPQLRLLFEVTYEAIVDAGYNPIDLKGTQTGVFVGNMFMESLEASSNDSKGRHIGYGLTGACDSMLSNYLSFFFDFKGPSLTVNTGCSASLAAFDLAVKCLLCGQCEFAIAAGTNLLLNPGTALHMLRLGMLAKDGSCKAFDVLADGYVRSEGIVTVLLTTKENARCSYAQVLNSMSSCDGHKKEGIAYPSSESQRELIWGVHFEVGLNPSEMFYVEAHGTGTQAGDFEECKALDDAIARSNFVLQIGDCPPDDEQVRSKHDTVKSERPLLVGSVKSNMGHSEPASGLAGLLKVLLSYQHGVIPSNLHYNSPNPRIPSLTEGHLSVVTKPTPIPPNARIGVNSFGFGGAITHVILKGCESSHCRVSRNSDLLSKIHTPEITMEDVTMILPLVSRTEEGLKQLMDFVATYRNDKEALFLLSHSFSRAPSDAHPHRGYVMWNRNDITTASTTLPPQPTSLKQQVWFIFDGMGSQWSGIGKDLLMYDLFADTIRQCYEALPPDVNNLIIDNQSEMAENSNLVVDEIAAVCAVSIGLVELLKAVGIEADGLIGHSLGELVLCYADGALSLKQCMQMAYWRIKCVIEADIPKGAMATVGLPWEEVKARCPANVWPVCSNSHQNVTVSGETSAVEKFIAKLAQEKIFTKMVKSSGLPYHSPLMQPAVNEKTLSIMKGIVKSPKQKSRKWIVTALPLDQDPDSVFCSAEFHIRSLVTPVFFYEALQKIPPGSVVIEVGAHALLQSILKRSLQSSSFTIIPLQDWKEKDQSVVFMRALGTCHNAGLPVDPLAIVKPVDLPVGPRTPSIGHLVSWEHVEEWHVPKYEDFILHSPIPMLTSKLYVTKSIKIDPHSTLLLDELALSDYRIDGLNIVPPTYLLMAVWKLFAESKGEALTKLPIMIEDTAFPRLVILEDKPVELLITLSTISGHFEVVLNESKLITEGAITLQPDNESQELAASTCSFDSEEMCSPRKGDTPEYLRDDVYKELSLRGYSLGESYRVVHELLIDSFLSERRELRGILTLSTASSRLSNEAILLCLMDGLFQLNLLQSCERWPYKSGLCNLMMGFNSLTVDPKKILSCVSTPAAKLYAFSEFDSKGESYSCGTKDMFYIEDVKYAKQPRKVTKPEPRIEKYGFQPYFQIKSSRDDGSDINERHSLATMMEIVFENIASKEVILLQVVASETEMLDSMLVDSVTEINQGCSTKSIQHDLLVVEGMQNSVKSSESHITGNVVCVESLTEESMKKITTRYDVIITSSITSAQCLLDQHKLTAGGFVLAVLKQVELEEDELTIDLPTCEALCPKLVAEQNYKAMKTLAHEMTTTSSKDCSQNVLLKLYRFLNANLLSDTNTAVVRVPPANGSMSWISKLKKLLTAKEGPKRIYCVTEIQREYPSGLVGMVNCLRLEGYANRVRCVQLDGIKWEEFLNDHTHLWDHIKEADMIMNVVRDCQVGSYVHVPLFSSLPCPSSDSEFQLSLDVAEFLCHPKKTYIITGGLGGFGLELAEWLVDRGAKYLILTSRTGTMTPYRSRKLQILSVKGVKVCETSTLDISDEDQAFRLVDMAANLSPKGLGGIFHLAVVLRDCLFENQTAKRFKTVLSSKSTGAINLDKALQKLSSLRPKSDPPLFVLFSSASAGLGNAGQTNYAFANSSMERLCEMRNHEGLQSLAIQWGAIGEVGILHTIMGGRDVESVAGTKPQPIHSCLSCLDAILARKKELSNCSTISCYIPALKSTSMDKKSDEVYSDRTSIQAEIGLKKDVKLTICQVLGIRDPNRLNLDSKLNELGLDSLMNFEVRNLLERDFGVTVSSRELQNMSVREVVEATLTSTSVACSDGTMESEITNVVHLSAGDKAAASTEGGKVEAVSSTTSVSTQSSFVNVATGCNEE